MIGKIARGTIVLAALLMLFLPVAASAQAVVQTACEGAAAQSAVCQEAKNTTGNPLLGSDGIITRVTQLLVWVVGVVAVLIIIISGLRYITSAGDAAGVNNAKNGILYALIGLVVAVLAQVIVTFVLDKL